jgi:hypothetical protein
MEASDAFRASLARAQLVPAHTQLLQDALQQAALTGTVEPQLGLWVYAQARLCSPALLLTATGLLAVCALLAVRPPFVLLFEYDARRPWRASSRLSWFSVLIAALVVLIAAAGLPVISGAG